MIMVVEVCKKSHKNQKGKSNDQAVGSHRSGSGKAHKSGLKER